MKQSATAPLPARYARMFRLMQQRVAGQLRLPIEIQLWGGSNFPAKC